MMTGEKKKKKTKRIHKEETGIAGNTQEVPVKKIKKEEKTRNVNEDTLNQERGENEVNVSKDSEMGRRKSKETNCGKSDEEVHRNENRQEPTSSTDSESHEQSETSFDDTNIDNSQNNIVETPTINEEEEYAIIPRERRHKHGCAIMKTFINFMTSEGKRKMPGYIDFDLTDSEEDSLDEEETSDSVRVKDFNHWIHPL